MTSNGWPEYKTGKRQLVTAMQCLKHEQSYVDQQTVKTTFSVVIVDALGDNWKKKSRNAIEYY